MWRAVTSRWDGLMKHPECWFWQWRVQWEVKTAGDGKRVPSQIIKEVGCSMCSEMKRSVQNRRNCEVVSNHLDNSSQKKKNLLVRDLCSLNHKNTKKRIIMVICYVRFQEFGIRRQRLANKIWSQNYIYQIIYTAVYNKNNNFCLLLFIMLTFDPTNCLIYINNVLWNIRMF